MGIFASPTDAPARGREFAATPQGEVVVELEIATRRQQLTRALAEFVHRSVSLSVTCQRGPVVYVNGHLEGVVEYPGNQDAPISIVVAGQDVVLFPDDLDGAKIDTSGDGLTVQLVSGAGISVDPTD
jgi:hypothetical protein